MGRRRKGKHDKRNLIKTLHQILGKTAAGAWPRASCSLPVAAPSSPLPGVAAAKGRTQLATVAFHSQAPTAGRRRWQRGRPASLHLKNTSGGHYCLSSNGGGCRSVSQGCSFQGPRLLPPLQQQRVGSILDLLDLDLLVVDAHRGQGTGHLLLDVFPPLLVLL